MGYFCSRDVEIELRDRHAAFRLLDEEKVLQPHRRYCNIMQVSLSLSPRVCSLSDCLYVSDMSPSRSEVSEGFASKDSRGHPPSLVLTL